MSHDLLIRFRQLLSAVPKQKNFKWSDEYLAAVIEWREMEPGQARDLIRDYVSSHADSLSMNEKRNLKAFGKKHLTEHTRPFFRCLSTRHTDMKTNAEQMQFIEILDVDCSTKLVAAPRNKSPKHKGEETKRFPWHVESLFLEGIVTIPWRLLKRCRLLDLRRGSLTVKFYLDDPNTSAQRPPFIRDKIIKIGNSFSGVTYLGKHLQFHRGWNQYYAYLRLRNCSLHLDYRWLMTTGLRNGFRDDMGGIEGDLKCLYISNVKSKWSHHNIKGFRLSDKLHVESVMFDNAEGLREYAKAAGIQYYGAQRLLLQSGAGLDLLEPKSFLMKPILEVILPEGAPLDKYFAMDKWREALEAAGKKLRFVSKEEWLEMMAP